MTHILSLPTELLERILTFICQENARSIQACRQTCHVLNTIITQSKLVQYLERVALLGLYDLLLHRGGGDESASASTTLDLPDRAGALQAWEKAWNAFAGGHDDDARVFRQERAPDMCIALPPSPSVLSSSAQVRHILATIIDPDPPVGPEQGEDGQHDVNDLFSFGPWFITATRHGINVRASYSYLDLYGYLDGAGGVGGGERAPGGIQSGEEENGDRDRDWTVIKVPVRNVLAFALSTELDLVVVISTTNRSNFNQSEEWSLVLRPLRFRDGTPHPCAKVPTIRLIVTSVSVLYTTHARVLGDYLLLWVGFGPNLGLNLSKLYLIAWKQGSITLLRESPTGKYGTVHMISDDVMALVQLDPLGIELCRISNMEQEAEARGDGDGGATNNHGSRSDGPRIDKLCTLLLPPLQQRRSGTGARVLWAYCVGEHPGHQMFSHGPWPDYRSAPLGYRQMFRQSTEDSIVCILIHILGCEGWPRGIEVVVRCATLLAYADGAHVARTATATIPSDAKSSNGDRDRQSASAQTQAVMGGSNADQDAEGSTDDDCVPWDAWGPQATAVSDNTQVGERFSLLGERIATIEHRICIRDYNPYRIRQAKASTAAKGFGRQGEEDEGEGNADTFYLSVNRRITERSTLEGGEWFQEDVTTSLPHLVSEVDVPGCRAINMEQDKVLFRVDNLDQITGRPSRTNGSEGFALYRM